MSKQTREVPVTALSSPVELAYGDETEESYPVSMLARSGEPIDHWYWGLMVHDFAGMNHKDTIAVDYCHNTDEVIGLADQFEVKDSSLHLTGELISTREGDRASEVYKLGKKGVPYEASITFDHQDLEVEYIPSDATVTVNGRDYTGPLTVFRNWNLRGVAICPYGYDRHSNTTLSRDNTETVTIEGANLVTQKQAETQNPETTETEVQTELQEPESKPQQKPEESRDTVLTQLSRYTERFGNDFGLECFKAGDSMETALDKWSRKLEADLQESRNKVNELNQKLDSLSLGEETPVDVGTESKTELSGDKQGKGFIRISGKG